MSDTLLGGETQAITETQNTEASTEAVNESSTENLDNVGNPDTHQVDWTQMLGDYANDPSIQKFKNPQDLAKSYLELQSLVGKKKIPVPENPEDLPKVLQQLGAPDSPDKYPDFEDVDKVFGSQDDWQEFKQIAHEAGLLPQQFEALYNKVKEIVEADTTVTLQQREQMYRQGLQQLQQEFGDELQAKLGLAQRVFNIMPEDVQQAVREAGLDINPNFVKFLANLGEYYKEDTFNVSSYSVNDAKTELQSILNNPNHPYFSKEHPEHEAAVDKVQKLYKIIYG